MQEARRRCKERQSLGFCRTARPRSQPFTVALHLVQYAKALPEPLQLWRIGAKRQFEQAFEGVLSVLADKNAPWRSEAQKLAVDILNLMPERDLANQYRRRLFSLLH